MGGKGVDKGGDRNGWGGERRGWRSGEKRKGGRRGKGKGRRDSRMPPPLKENVWVRSWLPSGLSLFITTRFVRFSGSSAVSFLQLMLMLLCLVSRARLSWVLDGVGYKRALKVHRHHHIHIITSYKNGTISLCVTYSREISVGPICRLTTIISAG